MESRRRGLCNQCWRLAGGVADEEQKAEKRLPCGGFVLADHQRQVKSNEVQTGGVVEVWGEYHDGHLSLPPGTAGSLAQLACTQIRTLLMPSLSDMDLSHGICECHWRKKKEAGASMAVRPILMYLVSDGCKEQEATSYTVAVLVNENIGFAAPWCLYVKSGVPFLQGKPKRKKCLGNCLDRSMLKNA